MKVRDKVKIHNLINNAIFAKENFYPKDQYTTEQLVDAIIEVVDPIGIKARVDELRRIPWKSQPRYSIEAPYLTKGYYLKRLESLESKLETTEQSLKEREKE